MHREIRELDRLDLGRSAAGSVAPWVRWVIAGAALTAVLVATAAARAVWFSDGLVTRLDGFWFRNGLPLAIAAATLLAFLPRGRVSRFVRLAALLPIILLAAMLAMWALWEQLAPRMPYLRRSAPLVLEVPISAVLGGLAVAIGLGALAARPRRGGAWIRTAVVISLVNLLLSGLWLPLASVWWGSGGAVVELERGLVIGSPAGLLALGLVPPLVIATAYAALTARQRGGARGAQARWTFALSVGMLVAIGARWAAASEEHLIYLNLVPFLAASALVAAAALAALVASLWLRGRAARARLRRDLAPVTGVIAHEEDDPNGVVACLELEGWLSGARALVDGFEVVSPAGRIPIPVGAELAASLPECSSILEVGEAVAVIRRGDRVVVGGLIEPAADHPFRSSAALVPGPGGVVVRRDDDGDGDFSSIALVAWRPCVAFLVILTAVAIPGLAGALVYL